MNGRPPSTLPVGIASTLSNIFFVISFALAKPPAVFQGLVVTFGKSFWTNFVFVYLDDIIFSPEDSCQARTQVLQCLLDHQLFVKAVQRFLGFTNFYRCFIIQWSPQADLAFQRLRQSFTIEEVDASDMGIMAVLSQKSMTDNPVQSAAPCYHPGQVTRPGW